MAYLFNLFYLGLVAFVSPWLLYKALTTGKYRRGMWTKLSGTVPPLSPHAGPTVWFHGVSVGEIHLLRQLVGEYRRRNPHVRCVVSTTTDTGLDEARRAFPDLHVILWPLDFSWAVNAALNRIQPDLVVLGEGENWPNFISACKRRGILVAIVNARMSPRSCARFQKVGFLARLLFARIDLIAAQNDEYARNYTQLGAPNVVVTGSMKYDGAQFDRANSRTQAMRELLHIAEDELVWVAGSTQAPEEEIVLGIFQCLRAKQPNLRLILVPRHRERFEEVARLLHASGIDYLRRSELPSQTPASNTAKPVILVDTIGELNAVWGLADIAYVGGSMQGNRGGQNMIEPAAYAAAVLFGPQTWNFKETVFQMLRHDAAIQVEDPANLEHEVDRLIADPAARARLGSAARELILFQQGATARTIAHLDALLATRSKPMSRAA